MLRFSKKSIPLYTQSALGVRQLTGKKRTPESLAKLVHELDPSVKGKYIRWICEHLAKRTFLRESHQWDVLRGKASNIYRILLAFDTCKHDLPEDQRNILNYLSLTELQRIVEPYDKARVRIDQRCISRLDYHAVHDNTLIQRMGSITVHSPKNIEEASALIYNPEVLDARNENLYANLISDGQIRIYIGAFSLMIGSLPTEDGQRGHVFDSFGEPAMFEDMLHAEGIKPDWKAHGSLLKDMILIDPSLPFDMQMSEPEPYQVALIQFPLILDEDREIPQDLMPLIMQNQDAKLAVLRTHL